MGFDLDPLDDLFPDGGAVKNARAGGKFQPKAKPRPRKAPSVSVPSSQSAQAVSTAEHPLTETIRTEEPSVSNEGCFSGVRPFDNSNSSGLVNPTPEDVAARESVGPVVGLHSDAILHDSSGHGHSFLGKTEEENADIFIGLESLDDFRPQSTTSEVNASSRSPPEVDIDAQLGNEVSTSCPVNTDAGGSLPHSEATIVLASDTRTTEERLETPVVSPVGDAAEECSTVQASPELHATLDPLTRGEATISANDGDFHIENRQFETEFQESEAFPCLDTLDIMSESAASSGRRTGKFQPVPKVQVHKEKKSAAIPNVEADDSVCWPDDAQWTSSQAEYMNEGSIPAFPPSDVLDFSPMGFSDSMPTDPTSEHLVNEEATNIKEISQSDAAICGEQPEAVPEMPEVEAVRSSGRRRKRINACQLVDESEDEGPNDGEAPDDCPGGSVMNEDNNDVEYRSENEAPKKRARRKSKKPVAEKEKPIRKRKKANEALDQSTKAPPKKFSHSTRRNRRQVDKALLETPEDEIDLQKLPLRDLIIFAEYKERTKKKEATTSETPIMNQSAANSSAHHYNDDETFGWDQQGRDYDDEQENPGVQESSTYFNYQSHMEKTRTIRWSKQDTELFYEAVQQFGTDLSMIQQLFPDRTRRQVKLKYKKEERQHPLRLREALTNRTTDHSHFELVIERLKKIAAQEKQADRDGSDGLTGEEAEEVAPETNEELAKTEKFEEGEEVQDIEAADDVPAVQSPVKSCDDDSEDDLYRWSQYKSEL